MDDEPGEESENHWLVVALRITLVALVILLGIVVVGKIVVSKANLTDSDSDNDYLGGPVPVSPITTQASPLPSSRQSISTSDAGNPQLPTLSTGPAPTDLPPSDPMPPGLVLSISPATVASGETFTVSGTYAGRDGVQLQLQRLENGIWDDYPNDISVSMGTFSSTAQSTMTGTNDFRVFDQSTGRASNVVSILVR